MIKLSMKCMAWGGLDIVGNYLHDLMMVWPIFFELEHSQPLLSHILFHALLESHLIVNGVVRPT